MVTSSSQSVKVCETSVTQIYFGELVAGGNSCLPVNLSISSLLLLSHECCPDTVCLL